MSHLRNCASRATRVTSSRPRVDGKLKIREEGGRRFSHPVDGGRPMAVKFSQWRPPDGVTLAHDLIKHDFNPIHESRPFVLIRRNALEMRTDRRAIKKTLSTRTGERSVCHAGDAHARRPTLSRSREQFISTSCAPSAERAIVLRK